MPGSRNALTVGPVDQPSRSCSSARFNGLSFRPDHDRLPATAKGRAALRWRAPPGGPRRPPGRRLEFLHSATWGRRPCLPCIGPPGPNPKSARSVTQKQKELTFNCFKHLHPTHPAKRTEKPNPACYNANRKSARQSTWRTSPDVPCRHSWRHVFAGITSKPVSPRVSWPVSKKQTKIQRN